MGIWRSGSVRYVILVFFISIFKAVPSEGRVEHICGSFYIDKDFTQIFQTLNPNEKKVVCGERGTSWFKVPEEQSIYHIKTFLQKQGYYSPEFKREDGNIIIELGEKTKVAEIEFHQPPENFQRHSKIQVIGEPLNSQTLDQVESWSVSHLKSIGYPCPQVQVTAGTESGVVHVQLEPGPRKKFSEIHFRQNVPEGLSERSLYRYYAFVPEQNFNSDLTLLTARRLMRDGVLRHSHFVVDCRDPITLVQKNSIGKPRLISVGLGASTEEGALAEVKWRHSRVDEEASSLTAELKVSFRTQEVSLQPKFYFFDRYPHLYFAPKATISREVEDEYRYRSGELAAGLGYQRDDDERQYTVSFSPTYNYGETEEGTGPDATQYISFNTLLSVVSHYYEYYARDPRTGYRFNLQWKARKSQVGAEFSSDLFKSNGTLLFNQSNFDPPKMVFGVRWALGTNSVREANEDDVPFEDRFFLGGDDDIRGFSRNAINNQEKGFYSSIYVGTELRVLKVLPLQLQPFFFVDAARVGKHSWNLDPELYWAPGVGVRWQSPIGAFRVSLGRGYINGRQSGEVYPTEEWVLFGSYGKVF